MSFWFEFYRLLQKSPTCMPVSWRGVVKYMQNGSVTVITKNKGTGNFLTYYVEQEGILQDMAYHLVLISFSHFLQRKTRCAALL